MKIIDLLNRIANGEEVPKKIKTSDGDIFYYDETDDNEVMRYKNQNDIPIIDEYYLNDEVEIIEEDKKIENLKSYISCGWNGTCKDLKRKDLFNDLKKMGNKINEIIDYINKENK